MRSKYTQCLFQPRVRLWQSLADKHWKRGCQNMVPSPPLNQNSSVHHLEQVNKNFMVNICFVYSLHCYGKWNGQGRKSCNKVVWSRFSNWIVNIRFQAFRTRGLLGLEILRSFLKDKVKLICSMQQTQLMILQLVCDSSSHKNFSTWLYLIMQTSIVSRKRVKGWGMRL